MPSYSGNYNPAVGPLIQVTILKLNLETGAPAGVGNNLHLFNALIDTGASCTCISAEVAQRVGLEPTGKAMMSGATGEMAVNQYMFGVGFVSVSSQEPNGLVNAGLQVIQSMGMQFEKLGSNFDILLGRDVICQGAFQLSFDGHYILSI